MVFQTFNLLHGFSAIENLMVAMMFSSVPAATHESRARALLGELGIERPDQAVETMSVGQQQRVAVARALACRPTLVLADEPTASLDPANAATAIGLLQRACRDHGAALLCTSHDPTLRAHFSRVIDLGTTEAAR
jgi:ABC-type lipoprotein export system ATPase subunit